MKLIIELDDDIAKGIRGENDCKVEAREIVRSFQATISKAIVNGTPYEERPQGKWGKYGVCPFCSYIRQWEDDNFCGSCGADLRINGDKK